MRSAGASISADAMIVSPLVMLCILGKCIIDASDPICFDIENDPSTL
jgi:hypothetical protein